MTTIRPVQWGTNLVLGAAVLLGTAPVAAQAIPAQVPRLGIGALRVTVGGLAILAALGPRQARTAWNASPKARLLLGAVGIAVYQVCFFTSVTQTGVGVAAAIANVASPLAAGLGRPLLGGGLPGGRWAGAAVLAVGGGGLLLAGAGRVTAQGVVLAVIAGMGYALYALVSAPLIQAVGALPAAGLTLFGAGVVLSPSLFTLGCLPASPANMAELAWLALGATALAYALFSRGLLTIPAERAVTILLAQPVAAAVLAYLWLGQSLAPCGVAGIAVLSASVLVLTGPTAGRRAIDHR